MKVQIKDILLKELPDGGVLTPEQAPVPAGAKKIEAPNPHISHSQWPFSAGQRRAGGVQS